MKSRYENSTLLYMISRRLQQLNDIAVSQTIVSNKKIPISRDNAPNSTDPAILQAIFDDAEVDIQHAISEIRSARELASRMASSDPEIKRLINELYGQEPQSSTAQSKTIEGHVIDVFVEAPELPKQT